MRALAAGLDLPTNALQENLTQMISGKLTDDGRQPRNMQSGNGDSSFVTKMECSWSWTVAAPVKNTSKGKRVRRHHSRRSITPEKNLSA